MDTMNRKCIVENGLLQRTQYWFLSSSSSSRLLCTRFNMSRHFPFFHILYLPCRPHKVLLNHYAAFCDQLWAEGTCLPTNVTLRTSIFWFRCSVKTKKEYQQSLMITNQQKTPIISLNDNTPLIQWSNGPQPSGTQPSELPSEQSIIEPSNCFLGFAIQGGSQGTDSLVLFGMKFDIMFKKISVNVCFNLPIGIGVDVKVLAPRETGHTPFNSLLIAAAFVLLKCQIYLSNGKGGGILKFTLQWTIWWWQQESEDARVPLSRMMLGWSVTTVVQSLLVRR